MHKYTMRWNADLMSFIEMDSYMLRANTVLFSIAALMQKGMHLLVYAPASIPSYKSSSVKI